MKKTIVIILGISVIISLAICFTLRYETFKKDVSNVIINAEITENKNELTERTITIKNNSKHTLYIYYYNEDSNKYIPLSYEGEAPALIYPNEKNKNDVVNFSETYSEDMKTNNKQIEKIIFMIEDAEDELSLFRLNKKVKKTVLVNYHN